MFLKSRLDRIVVFHRRILPHTSVSTDGFFRDDENRRVSSPLIIPRVYKLSLKTNRNSEIYPLKVWYCRAGASRPPWPFFGSPRRILFSWFPGSASPTSLTKEVLSVRAHPSFRPLHVRSPSGMVDPGPPASSSPTNGYTAECITKAVVGTFTVL